MADASPPPCIALLSEVIDMRYLVGSYQAACPGIDLRIGQTPESLGAVGDIDAAVCWYPPHGLLARLPGLQLVQSLAAGVDHLLADPDLPRALPLCRVVDPTMSAGMNAYVTWAVVQRHRHMQGYVESCAAGRWEEQPISSPLRHTVGIAGLGALGLACAQALAGVGYRVRGWSRSPKANLPVGVEGFHGPDRLDAFLTGCDTLVCLLPLTPDTRGFLNAACFSKLARGAHVVNVGRGAHLVEADLLAAIAEGQIGAATLDAFTEEPLPLEHPFWREPRILVTPHVATRTERSVIVEQTLANLDAVQRGVAPANQVDLARGY